MEIAPYKGEDNGKTILEEGAEQAVKNLRQMADDSWERELLHAFQESEAEKASCYSLAHSI